MNIILFIATIVISFIAIRIGAIAFQLTGLEWSLATFQSLSCFTGTGFTTREAELIVGNPQRRRIASVLMVFRKCGPRDFDCYICQYPAALHVFAQDHYSFSACGFFFQTASVDKFDYSNNSNLLFI